MLDLLTACGNFTTETHDERVNHIFEVSAAQFGRCSVVVAPRANIFRFVAIGHGHEVVVGDNAEVDRAGRGQQIGHDEETSLVLARRESLRRILLAIARRVWRRDGDSLNRRRDGSRVEIRERALDHSDG